MRNAIVKQRSCQLHELHGICHLHFYHLIFIHSPSLSFAQYWMHARVICIEVFAVYNERVSIERFFDSQEITLLPPHMHTRYTHARLLLIPL